MNFNNNSQSENDSYQLSIIGNIELFKKKYLRHLINCLLIIIIISGIYFKTFKGPDVLNGSDITRYFYFSRAYLHNYYNEHNALPKWEPYTFGGKPFFSMIQNAALYPLTYLTVIFNTGAGINITICVNLILSALFMYAFMFVLCKSYSSAFISGMIYALGGFSTMCVFLGHITIINTLPYLPASFLFLKLLSDTYKIRFAVLGGLMLSLQFFGGQPQFLFYTLFTLFLYFIFLVYYNSSRLRIVLLFALFLSVFAIISLPYYLKVNEFLKLTVRSEAMGGYDFYTYWSFEPKKIITAVMPFFYGTSFDGDYWRILWRKLAGFECYNAFLGLTAVFFIILSFVKKQDKNKIFFAILFIFAIIIALGSYTPVYKFFHYYIPGFKMFRWPVRFMFIYQFAGAVLAGYGFLILKKYFFNAAETNYFTLRKIMIIILIFISVFSAILFGGKKIIYEQMYNTVEKMIVSKGGSDYNPPEFYFSALQKIQNRINDNILRLNIILAALVLFLFLKNIKILNGLFILIILYELIYFHSYFVRTVDNSGCVISKEIHNTLDSEYRIISDSELYPPWINILFNKMSVNGYEPFILKKYAEFAGAIETADKVPENLLFIKPDYSSRLIDLLSVKYIITERDDLPEEKYFKKYRINEKLKIFENKYAAPLFYVSAALECLPDKNIIAKLNEENYDYNKIVYSNDNAAIEFFTSENFLFEISEKNIKDDYAKFVVKTNAECVGVFNYIYFPGWRVLINGKSAQLLNINYLFMGAVIPEGLNTIEFIF